MRTSTVIASRGRTSRHGRIVIGAAVLAVATAGVVRASVALAAGAAPSPSPAGPVEVDRTALTVAVDDRPIAVADAYHGMGVYVCTGGRERYAIADAYHGVGVELCA